MDEWTDIPEALRETVRDIAINPEFYGYEVGAPSALLRNINNLTGYMVSEHTCQFGHHGSKVNACEELALIDSAYCGNHGGN